MHQLQSAQSSYLASLPLQMEGGMCELLNLSKQRWNPDSKIHAFFIEAEVYMFPYT